MSPRRLSGSAGEAFQMISDVSAPQEELREASRQGWLGDTGLPEAECPGDMRQPLSERKLQIKDISVSQLI